MSDLADYSRLFEPAENLYLLAHSVGRLPAATRQLAEESFFQPWARGDDEPWNSWLENIERFRAALANLFSTDMELLCPQPNLSSALGRIISALPPEAHRNVILLSEDDFPSMGFVLQQAQRQGYHLRYLPGGTDITDAAVWQKHLSDDVGMVFITHVQSNSGMRAAVVPLLSQLRTRGIVSIVDVAQSAGVIPIDLGQWQADFVIGSCVKWLCGGPGAGFLWADSNILTRCQPLDVGWFSHEQPFEFDIHDFRYHPSALRFWGGTPSVLPYVTATAGIELLLGIGIERVQQHNENLRDILTEGIASGSLISPPEHHRAGATAVLHCGERQQELVAGLRAAGVAFDQRPMGIRLSPHLYNSAEEMAVVSNCLR